MKTNKQMLSKKQQIEKMISLPTITLAAEEADRFIDYIVDESVMKGKARVIKMNKQVQNIRALGLGTGDFLHPGDTFSSSEYKKVLSHNKIELASKKVRGCIAIFDDDLEDNIEGDAFVNHLMKMVAKKISNELDIAYWIGNTGASDAFGDTDIRSLWDGWRFQIANGDTAGDTYENDVSGVSILLDATSGSHFTIGEGRIGMVAKTAPYNWEFKYNKMLQSLDSKYKVGGLGNLAFYNSDQVTQNYIEALAARSTVVGDNAILSTVPIQYGMVPLVSCPNMPITMDGNATPASEKCTGGSYTDCLLTPNGNMIIGIQRDIKIESQREAADEATYWFYSMRATPAIENINSCILLRKLIVTGTMLEA